MNVHDHIGCLKESGLITDAQEIEAKQIISKLPTTSADLLAVIAAFSIMGNDAVFEGAPISTEYSDSTGNTDPHQLATIPDGATRAFITVHDNNIIYNLDGTNPTALNPGRVGLKDTSFSISSLSGFRYATQIAAASKISVEYY